MGQRRIEDFLLFVYVALSFFTVSCMPYSFTFCFHLPYLLRFVQIIVSCLGFSSQNEKH